MSLRPDTRLPWLRAPRPLFYFTALKRCRQYSTAPGKEGEEPENGNARECVAPTRRAARERYFRTPEMVWSTILSMTSAVSIPAA